MKRRTISAAIAVMLSVVCLGTVILAAEYLTGIQWAEPKIIDPGPPGGPPSDAVVLFNGTDMSQWEGGEKWTVQDGHVVAGPGKVQSKAVFGDCQVHVEWAAAEEITGDGQGRSNSGVFLMGIYEIQVLDSYDNTTYFDGQCGAIYKQHPPLVNACRKPGEWQAFDIIWKAPRFDEDGKQVSPAFITVLQNGVVIQNHFELLGDTPYNRPPEYRAHPDKGPISLQYHGNPVRFRNIWVREIKELGSEQIHQPKIVGKKPDKKPQQEKKAAKPKKAKSPPEKQDAPQKEGDKQPKKKS